MELRPNEAGRKSSTLVVILVALGMCALAARGETPPEPSTPSQAVSGAVTGAPPSLFGVVELRPTVAAAGGRLDSRNSLEVGYRIAPNVSLGYWQAFDIGLHDPSLPAGQSAAELALPDGFVKFLWLNAWTEASGGWALDYESHVHLPTSPISRARGKVTELRNQLNLTRRLTSATALTLSWIPVVHLYSRSGAVVEGQPVANPLLENRLELIPRWELTPALTLFLPLKWYQTRHSAFQPGARFHDRWVHLLLAKAELLYQASPDVVVGAAYETGNLAVDTLSGLRVAEGFDEGIAQLVFKANL